MPYRDDMAIVAAFNLVNVQKLSQFTHWSAAKLSFHGPKAGMAEEPEHASMPVISFLAKLVQPLINKGRDTTLLRARCGMGERIHGCCRSLAEFPDESNCCSNFSAVS